MNNLEAQKEKSREKIFDAILEYAGACHAEDIVKEMDAEEREGEPISVPRELDVRIKMLITRYHRKEKMKKVWALSEKVLSKVAVFFFITFVSFSILVTSVEAVRVPFFNFVVRVGKEYTSIDLKNRSDTDQEEVSDLPPEWEDAYLPAFVPDGFQITKTETLQFTKIAQYGNDDGELIVFQQKDGNDVNTRVDTENAVSEEISINGQEGLLIEKEDRITLIWQKEDLLFSLMSEDVDKGILIQMAESIEKK